MGNAGKVLLVPKGTYSTSKIYQILDMVSYDGCGWVAKQQVPYGQSPSKSSVYWMKLTESGVLISNSSAVSVTGTAALDAVQNNPSIEGSLANKIETINNNLSWTLYKTSVGTATTPFTVNGAHEVMVMASVTSNTDIVYTAIVPYERLSTPCRLMIESDISMYFNGAGYCQGNKSDMTYYLYYK